MAFLIVSCLPCCFAAQSGGQEASSERGRVAESDAEPVVAKAPPLPYRATAWLRIEKETPYLAYPPDRQPKLAMFRHTQAQLILSPLVLSSAAQSEELAAEFTNRKIRDPEAWLRERLEIAFIGRSELFTVTVTDEDQELACLAASALIQAYFKLQAQREAYATQRLIEQLQEEQERSATRLSVLQLQLQEQTSAKDEKRAALVLSQEELERMEDIRKRIDERLYRLRLEARAPARVTPLKDAAPPPEDEAPDTEEQFLADVELGTESEPEVESEGTLRIRAQPILPSSELRKLMERDKTPWYVAEAWIQLNPNQPYLVYPPEGQLAFDEYAATQIALIRSPLVLERAIAVPGVWKRLGGLGVRSPVKWLVRRVMVEPVGESEFYRIAVFATDRQLAADLVNSVYEAYFRVQAQDQAYRNQRILELLEEERGRHETKIGTTRHTLAELEKLYEDHDQRPDVLQRREELAREEETYQFVTNRGFRMRFEARAPPRMTQVFEAEPPAAAYSLPPKLDALGDVAPAAEPPASNSATDQTPAETLRAAPGPPLINPVLAAGIGFLVALASVWLVGKRE